MVMAHPPETVFALLSDLRRHWPLLGEDLVTAELTDHDAGATLEVRAPFLPIRRRVNTEIVHSDPPRLFRGQAEADGTIAVIEWQLEPVEEGARVQLTGSIFPGGMRDRVLVRAVRPWLTRRTHEVLVRLDEELDADAVAGAA